MSKGTVVYQCVDCLSVSDVDINQHIAKDVYIECGCGERCEPMESPASRIADLLEALTKGCEYTCEYNLKCQANSDSEDK